MGLSQEDLIHTLERELRTAMDARPEAGSVGLGIPCTIDRRRGVAVMAVNLQLADVPIRDLMQERLGVPVAIDNDANAAVLAEHRFGAARGATNVVMLTIGTGIGGGLVIEGELYRGSAGAGAELGHVVIEADGPPCQGNCPNHGCVEVMASGTAIAREGLVAAEKAPDSALGRALAAGVELDGKEVTEAALEGDLIATRVLETVGRRLGVAFASFANIFDPDVIVVGGGVIAAGDLLLAPARAELAARALPPMNETPVTAAEFGPDAGMVGAATMAMLELEGGKG
jgi:glucokinase